MGKLGKRSAGRSADGSGAGSELSLDERSDEQPSDRELEAYEVMERSRSELGDDEGYVILSKRNDKGQLQHIDKVNARVFDVEYVMKKHGGGGYLAKYYRSGIPIDDGGFIRSVSFEIHPSVKADPEVLPGAATSNGGSETAGLMVLIRAMIDELKTIRATPPVQATAAPAIDPMAMIEKLATTMRMLTPAPLAPPPAMDLEKQLGIIEKVVNVGTSIVDARGGGGEMSSGDMYAAAMLKVADPIIEVIKDKVESDREQRALRRGHQPALPPPGASSSAAPAKPEDNNMLPPWVLEVRRLVPMILTRAARGKSAENTAYFVLDDLSDMTRAKLAELAATESFDADVMKLLPQQLQQRPEWCQEFIEACKDYLLGVEEEVEEEAEGPEPEAGTDGEAEGPSPSPIPE